MRHLAITLTILVSSSVAFAESPTESSGVTRDWRFSAGVSPVMAALKGGGIEADVMPPGHFRFFASVFTLTIPTLLQRDNADEGWSIRDTGGGLGAEYLFSEDGRGFFVGAVAETQNHHDERMGLSQNSLELGVAAEIGYRWMPWKNLYITPRLMLVAPLYMSEPRELGGVKFDEGPVRPVPLVYTGWQF